MTTMIILLVIMTLGTRMRPSLAPAFLRDLRECHEPRSVALCLRGGWRSACHAVRPRLLLLLLVMVAEQVGHEDWQRNRLARRKSPMATANV
jgi:hypothetical protein